MWVLHNVGGNDSFFNDTDDVTHYIESGIFESINGMMWKLKLEPAGSVSK